MSSHTRLSHELSHETRLRELPLSLRPQIKRCKTKNTYFPNDDAWGIDMLLLHVSDYYRNNYQIC
jgi:hypothetical protein